MALAAILVIFLIVCLGVSGQPGCPDTANGTMIPASLRGQGTIATSQHARMVNATLSINSAGVDIFDAYSTALVSQHCFITSDGNFLLVGCDCCPASRTCVLFCLYPI